jgi:Sensors of blue-light using FAD
MHRILYTSSRTDDTDKLGQSPDFTCIGEHAARKNAALHVTGFLICTPTWYAQVLEGEKSQLLTLLEEIAADPRHSNLTVLDTHPMTTRMFSNWTMTWRHQSISNRILFLERELVQIEQPTLIQTSALYDLAKVLAAA